MFKKLFALIMALLMVASLMACTSNGPASTPTPDAGTKTEAPAQTETPADEALRIAMLLPGVINDGGWNAMAYAALKEAETVFSAETAYTENVTQNDQVRIARQYAQQGYDVIIGHGYEFGDSLTEVSAEFPDIYFINYGGGVKNGANLGSVQYAYGETGALMGVLVGMSGVKKVGVVMAFENPTGMQEMKNVEITAQKYNPDVEFVYSYTADWNDIAKAKEAASALLANGAEVICSDLSGPYDAIIQAVKEKNAKFIAVTMDGYDKDPEHCLGSAVHDATKAMLAALQMVKDGTFKGDIFAFGIKDGVMFPGQFGPSVTDEMKAEVAKVQQEIVDGKYELYKIME